MTWLDHKALMIARQLREPASRRRYTRRLHELDPVHGGHRSREDMCLLHETPRERVLSLAAGGASLTCGATGTGGSW